MILTQHFQCYYRDNNLISVDRFLQTSLARFNDMQLFKIFIDIFLLKFSSYDVGSFRLSYGIFYSVLKTNQISFIFMSKQS